MWRKPSIVLLTLGTAGAVTLTACGSDSSPARSSGSASTTSSASSPASSPSSSASSSSASSADAYAAIKASIDAARQAKTFRVQADGTSQGKPLKLDLHYGSNGVDGTVETMGTEFKIKAVGETIYFEAPAAFWRAQGGAQGDTIAKRFGDKWVKTSASSQVGKGFGEFSDSSKFIAQFTKGFSQDGLKGAKQVGTGNVDGTPTKTYSDDSKEGTIDIAASGKPYPLKLNLTATAKSNVTGKITLSEWDKAYTVEPPSDSVSLPS